MGQAGITSAIGMAPESTFRSVPHSGGANPRAIGVASTNPHRFFTVEPGGGVVGSPELTVPSDEIDGGIGLGRTILTGKMYQGSHSFKGDAENLYYPLLGICGKDVQALVNGSTTTPTNLGAGASVYRHVLTPNKFAPSFTFEEIFGDGNFARLSSGVIVQKLELDFGDILTATMGLYGHRQIPNWYDDATGVEIYHEFGSTATLLPGQMGGDGVKTVIRTANPTYVDVAVAGRGNGPFTFAGMKRGSEAGFENTFLKIDGTDADVKILSGLRLSLERTITSRKVGGSGYDAGDVTGGAYMVTGSLPCVFQDSKIQGAALGHSKLSLNFKFVGVQIGATPKVYEFEVYLPDVRVQNPNLTIPDGPIPVNPDFVCRVDRTLGYACKFSLQNTTTNAGLGCDAGSTGAAGGLGGANFA